MLLGGSVVGAYEGARAWARAAAGLGYAASTCPLPRDASREEALELVKIAGEQGVVIGEVGVWRNILSPDEKERADNLAFAKERLALAEDMGVACCVNIAGARGPQWDGAYQDNYGADTYALIVDSVREIIDAVKPGRAYYTLEPMPWMHPDSPEDYLQLIRDIDRAQFAVHMDFVNLLSSPWRYLHSEAFIADCFGKLAPHIKSVHIKDALMDPHAMPAQILECAPGKGRLNYHHILTLIDRLLPRDTPVLLEHMSSNEAYREAMAYVGGIAEQLKIPVR
ncbi:MAG: sugar phosphate isomerase/epimerase family protein [Christensenellales bacterium]